MKILQVNAYESPGRRFNGLALKPHLADLGIQSKHFAWIKDSEDPDVVTLTDPALHRSRHKLLQWERKLSLQSTLYPYARDIAQLPEFAEADLIHYHIIHADYMSMLSLPGLTAKKPSVWTLHDPWAMTGHCLHPYDCPRWKIGCGACPYLKIDFPIKRDTTAFNFWLKKRAYQRSQFDLIVASSWMEAMVTQSPLLSSFPLHRVPFGLDLDFFKPGDAAAAKARLGIDPDRVVISFRAVPYHFKGLDYVLAALENLHTDVPICLLALNEKGHVEHLRDRFQVVEFDWTNDDALLKDAYNASDFFVMPSLAEAFGLMAIEAMACGKPTICFDGTALPGVVFAPEAGIAVPARDAAALGAAIKLLVENSDERQQRGTRARQLAQQHYDIRQQARHTADVYRQAITHWTAARP